MSLKGPFFLPSDARGGKLTQLEWTGSFPRSIDKEGENKVEADTQIRIAENGVIRRLNPVREEALSPREIEEAQLNL
ncbi:MAG: hypothetical protein V3U81_04275, partial [Candidatus Binatia bacterium]